VPILGPDGKSRSKELDQPLFSVLGRKRLGVLLLKEILGVM
jgi:hypothetical protein